MNDKGFICPTLGVYVGGHVMPYTDRPAELSGQETFRSYENQLLNKGT